MSTHGRSDDPALRLAFYGDDFTGSTDALEVLAFAGLRCALFLRRARRRDAARSWGRSTRSASPATAAAMSPAEMDAAAARGAGARWPRLPAPLLHYKVCSTFDSSPPIGSIGRVMDLARAAFGDGAIPVVAGTPALGRYCAFGNLFARSGTDGRVHRHRPSPDHERASGHADARGRPRRCTSVRRPRSRSASSTAGARRRPRGGRPRARSLLAADARGAILFDGATPAHLTEVGRLLERLARGRGRPLFAVGSSGLEYALTQWWAERGDVAPALPAERRADLRCGRAGAGGVGQRVRIERAADRRGARRRLRRPAGRRARARRRRRLAATAASAGRARDRCAARRPQRDAAHRARCRRPAHRGDGRRARRGRRQREQARHQGGRLLGQRLGDVVDGVLRAVPLRRLVLSGGDTSSQITQRLAPEALLIAARLAPGAPLCRVLVAPAASARRCRSRSRAGRWASPTISSAALRGRGPELSRRSLSDTVRGDHHDHVRTQPPPGPDRQRRARRRAGADPAESRARRRVHLQVRHERAGDAPAERARDGGRRANPEGDRRPGADQRLPEQPARQRLGHAVAAARRRARVLHGLRRQRAVAAGADLVDVGRGLRLAERRRGAQGARRRAGPLPARPVPEGRPARNGHHLELGLPPDRPPASGRCARPTTSRA